MDLKNVQKELSKFGKFVIQQSRSRLSKMNKNQSRELYDSLKAKPKAMPNSLSLTFEMEFYGMFQDQGVKGAKNSSKAPNSPFSYKDGGAENRPSPRAFEKFAKDKGISPFAISYAVWRDGIKPSLFFTKPFEQAFAKLDKQIIEKFGLDLDQLFAHATKETLKEK